MCRIACIGIYPICKFFCRSLLEAVSAAYIDAVGISIIVITHCMFNPNPAEVTVFDVVGYIIRVRLILFRKGFIYTWYFKLFLQCMIISTSEPFKFYFYQ